MLKIKDKEEYEIKTTTIYGYSGRNYEENLERFKKELYKKGGYIVGIVTNSSIIIYKEKADLVEKVGEIE